MDIQGSGRPDGINQTDGAKASSQPSAKKTRGFFNPNAPAPNPDNTSAGRALAQRADPSQSSFKKQSNGDYRTHVDGVGDKDIAPADLQAFFGRVQDAVNQQDMQGLALVQKLSSGNADLKSAIGSVYHLAS